LRRDTNRRNLRIGGIALFVTTLQIAFIIVLISLDVRTSLAISTILLGSTALSGFVTFIFFVAFGFFPLVLRSFYDGLSDAEKSEDLNPIYNLRVVD
tara:strand:- start:251 stop:541 length:291 start_codon:yes stop_codon:yes gene_type:complete